MIFDPFFHESQNNDILILLFVPYLLAIVYKRNSGYPEVQFIQKRQNKRLIPSLDFPVKPYLVTLGPGWLSRQSVCLLLRS